MRSSRSSSSLQCTHTPRDTHTGGLFGHGQMSRSTLGAASRSSSRVFGLVAVLLLLLLQLCCLCEGLSPRVRSPLSLKPPPSSVTVPKQTPIQAAQWSRLSSIAQEASIAATPQLLDYFNSNEFRSQISDLPFANDSSEDILAMVGSALVGSTVTHGVPTQYGAATILDLTAQTISDLRFIPNIWEMLAMGFFNANTTSKSELLAFQYMDKAEQTLFGFSPFTGQGNESYFNVSLSEAQSRVSYGALNIWQLADAIQLFGPVSLVLDPTYYKSMSILSPVDTGTYTACCLEGYPICFLNNCTNITFGTFEYYNHLLLASSLQTYWNYTLPELLHRIYSEPTPNVTLWDTAYYWEVDILGNLVFPYAVSYLIVDYQSLFGSEIGLDMQNWCQQENWVLVWSRGFFNLSQTVPISELYNKSSLTTSFLDPTTTDSLINYFPSSNLTTMFWEQWKAANLTRGDIVDQKISSMHAEHLWNELWMTTYSMLPGAYHLHRPPSFTTTCDSTVPCIGVDDEQNCICYATG